MALEVDGRVAVETLEPFVDKLDKAELQWPSSPESTSPHHSPIVVESSAASSSSQSASPPPSSILLNGEVLLQPAEAANVEENGGGKGAKSKPASSVTAAKPASGPPGAKPKSSKARSPSPAPSALPQPPLRTVRLDIKLGGPEDYEVDISSLSKVSGQRPPTPTAPAKHDTSDESNSEGDDEGDGNKHKKKRRKKKNRSSEYYDTTDPFIDDSELAQDERTFFAQTKQKGFYVSSGQVALLNTAPAVKKPKSRKVVLAPSASVAAALSSGPIPASLAASLSQPLVASTSKPLPSPKKVKLENGTRDEPITLPSDNETAVSQGMKRKAEAARSDSVLSGSQEGAKKRRKTREIQPFHPELDAMFAELKVAISKESWETKGKFPPNIKPILAKIALKAILLGEYDENFFNVMPTLFPYNKFTMTKLIKRTVWRDHTTLLVERQEALLKELKVLADQGFPKAKEEWEKSVTAWERRHDRTKADTTTEAGSAAHSAEGSPVPAGSDTTPTPQLAPRTSIDDGGHDTGMELPEDENAAQSAAAKRDAHPPGKKYRLTDTMKATIWQLVCLSNEVVRLENEKNAFESNNQVVSDQGVRKTLYQKIVNAFPDGWLSSGQISREVSVMKKKYEKEVLENEA